MRTWACLLLSVTLLGSAGCASRQVPGENGLASYYADRYHGRTTASGEIFDIHQLTAAHRTLPFGTRVRVTNLGNGKSVIVRITDRGPFVKGRVIDLAPAAARRIDMIREGVVPVKVEVIGGTALAGAE